MTAPARRGRPPRLTREAVAEAVLAVGFPQLTFAAVRERLGVGESTLFRHAPDRNELVRIGLERIIEVTPWPPLRGGWREVLTDWAHALWQACERHPGAAGEASRGLMPLAGAEIADDLAVHLISCGFTAERAVLACDLVFDLVLDSRRGVELIDKVVEQDGPSRSELAGTWQLDRSDEGIDPARRAVRQAKRDVIDCEPGQWLDRKLQVVLDGLAVLSARSELYDSAFLRR